ncbi:alkaline phosphatase family protein [Rubritalea profundi]|uniref:Alkaline phosphatase n=1 Tax=Rubritalea profundi TaxID=1658618 RepID=A0A2S7TZ72_9BACT|nr:alkaline phosphatase family protein [Rubritalea profundi]PQJ27273.1 alkaline phosphatase [Rubritalea profundi]
MTKHLTLVSMLGVALALPSAAAPSPTHEKPRLIVQITVDQLRGDLPTRYIDRLGKGGLRYLLEKGIHYNNAHHAHANTETIVGHVTLATGAHPAAHGMIGNLWFDRATGATTYNIEDPDYHLLTKGADVDAATEIDPTQKAATSDGRSPKAILTTTFADELAVLTAGKAKIFSVSVKDRGAVSMAGHAGKAFWFSKASNQFVTSSYYYDKYPQWIVDWNAKKLPESYANTAWELMLPIESYLFGDRDDQEWESSLDSYGRTFPHKFTTPKNPYFSTFLTISPVGDEMTTDLAKTVIDKEGLGDDPITDFLGVSYSATDYIGHFFGPSSLEAEDNILRLDRTLADLFAYVDKEVGLENTLIVLSADHGCPESPGYLKSLGIPADYVSPDKWDKKPVIARIKKKFGIEGKMIEGYDHPYIYLTSEIIKDPKIDLAALETMIAKELVAFPSVSYAVPSTSLERGTVPENILTRAVLNNYNPARSGNIYVVFNPGWFINDLDGLSVACVHGSPWRYDTYVPIIFAGNGIKPQKVSRRVHTVDVALTLATAIGTRPPSGAAGEVLLEVVGQKP